MSKVLKKKKKPEKKLVLTQHYLYEVTYTDGGKTGGKIAVTAKNHLDALAIAHKYSGKKRAWKSYTITFISFHEWVARWLNQK